MDEYTLEDITTPPPHVTCVAGLLFVIIPIVKERSLVREIVE